MKLTPHRFRSIAVAAVVPLLLALSGCTRYGATLARPEDPVVLDGSSTPKLLGAAVAAIVGFAWDGSTWHQIPVQVDERDYVNPGQILHRATTDWAVNPDGTGFTILVYTAPTVAAAGYTSWPTYVGADSDPTFDANDQVSFLADDSGKQSPVGTATPPGTVASSQEELKITDPLNSSQFGYVYLFTSDNAGLTGGSAGTTGVQYTFSLDSGDYRDTYKMGTTALAPNNVAGFNPEHSTITTGAYKLNYSDRWLNDGLQITANGATGADILERGRFQFTPGVCSRSEETFDGGATNPYEGAFIANISGPVRAIRSYMGANSGPYTAMTDVFYPQRSDSTANLRVHPIPGVMAFDDFTTGLTGMTYSDDQNTGVRIDGARDTISATRVPAWQMVSGAPGTIVTTRSISTDITGLQLSTYYLDQNPASPVPCTGDAAAWGQNGVQILGPGGGELPCTDPTRTGCSGAAKTFSVTRYRYYARPNLSSTSAAALAGHALSLLHVTVSG